MAKLSAAEFAKLADAATAGKWHISVGIGDQVSGEDHEICDCWYKRDAAFIAACGTERQRIHRALLLLEMVESDSNMRVDGMFTARRVVAADFLLERLDAASQEVGA